MNRGGRGTGGHVAGIGHGSLGGASDGLRCGKRTGGQLGRADSSAGDVSGRHGIGRQLAAAQGPDGDLGGGDRAVVAPIGGGAIGIDERELELAGAVEIRAIARDAALVVGMIGNRFK